MFRNRKLLLFINRALYIGAAAMMIAGLVLTVAPQPVAAGGAGAIWTTKGGCSSDSQQDVNHYLAGDWIYIKGSGFTANTTLPWTITGNPGGASADPEIIVAQNPPLISTDTNGNFCIQAYQVKNDDRGEYTVDVPGASKNDNYRITDDLCPTINGKQKTDTDNDGIGDACDNCPAVANSTQTDTDGDGIGDACEVTPPTDLCPDLDGIQETYPYDGSCTPPPTDLCPDLDGIQETYPYDGSCTPPPTDLCPDLDGIQETYPYDGSCTPPPTDLCPDLDGIQTAYPYPNDSCVPPEEPTDLCPDLEGVQTAYPYDGSCSETGGDPDPDPTTTPVPQYDPPAVASVESVAVLIPVTGMDLNTGMNSLTYGGFGLLGLGLVMSGIRRKYNL